MKIKEFLEYVSEALAIISISLYITERPKLPIPFSLIDAAYIIALCSFLWSRGYAEYLERILEELERKRKAR